jgi:hypothetical protein
MERTLADAQEEAREAYEELLRTRNPQDETIYIMHGCECRAGGGKETLYYVHVMHDSKRDAFWRMHNAPPIAAYNPRPESNPQ